MHEHLIESCHDELSYVAPFPITHAEVLYRLARYNEALETCNSTLSIPTGINDDSKKELWVLKGKIMKRQDAMYLATVKHEIQEMQERKRSKKEL